MEITDIINESTHLSEFNDWLEKISDHNNIPRCNYNEKYKELISFNYEDIVSFTQEECFAYATLMTSYVLYLQRIVDHCSSIINYASAVIDRECSKQWSNYDKFMPTNVKRQAIIKDNSFLTLLEKCCIRLSSLKDRSAQSCSDLRRLISIYQDFGRSKQWK
jgi:hypothetical protein